MKTYTTKELNANVFAYILNAIDSEDYNGNKLNTDAEKLQFLADRFKSEFLCEYELKRNKTYQDCFKSWISGLAIDIAYYDQDIIELAHKWNSIPVNSTDAQESKIVANWFHFIAAKTMQLFSKHKITSFYL